MSADETVPYRDMLKLGLTGRQVDYWTRQGYLRSTEPQPGSGHRRAWPVVERDIAVLMARLISAGLSVEVAAKAARESIETGRAAAWIADGIVVTWNRVPA